MGKRGPAPKPTALKMVRGERADRLNRSEPLAEGEVIRPAWLSEDALGEWDALAPSLQRSGVMTAWDVASLAAWCDAVVRLRTAVRHLDDEGEVIHVDVFGRDGQVTGFRVTKSPWMQVWKDANEVIARVGARFGLTPSDRSQLKVGDGGQANASERLLG